MWKIEQSARFNKEHWLRASKLITQDYRRSKKLNSAFSKTMNELPGTWWYRGTGKDRTGLRSVVLPFFFFTHPSLTHLEHQKVIIKVIKLYLYLYLYHRKSLDILALGSAVDPWHFGTDPDLRIRNRVLLRILHRSCSFRQGPSRCHQKIIFYQSFLVIIF